jgi:hypothetical protein
VWPAPPETDWNRLGTGAVGVAVGAGLGVGVAVGIVCESSATDQHSIVERVVTPQVLKPATAIVLNLPWGDI